MIPRDRDSDHDRDDLEIVVRAAMQARTDLVTPAPDALSRIRARTSPRRHRGFIVGLASLATAVTVAAVIALSGVTPHPNAVPPLATVSELGRPVTPAPTPDRVPVYYTADVDGHPLLYREFHPIASPPTLAARIREAVAIMLAGQPSDPDYSTAWPAGVSVDAVTLDTSANRASGTVAVVGLTGTMPGGAAGAIASQQLVYTATAVAADRGVQIAGVMVRHDGADWSDEPVTRAAAVETLAPVWLISPQQGATVGTTVDVHVSGLLSASVRLRVLNGAGAVIDDRLVALQPAATRDGDPPPSRGERHVSLTLEPGRYTLEAYASTGDSGRAAVDNHAITVTGSGS